ncbi:MAG: SDR family oxidoreductase [Candidatus Diapherotrites archaeon]|uniref:SDR family oxidoreductase n=1 Tax=Candidatus Iainarchaeum sp. TaxID=3101447 RepID=A0A8T4L560_9ARCH|nr:SDR family oxidoreductase [Candidatus Diapherotrites archaeon]
MVRMVIVTGANGALGKAYVDFFEAQPATVCVGISRKAAQTKNPNTTYLQADLSDPRQVEQEMRKLPLSDVHEIVLVHAVGKFKLDPRKEKEFDREVWESNVDTFRNVSRALLFRVRQQSKRPLVTLCAFGSVSDKYNIFAWRSYTAAKNYLRALMQKLSRLEKNTKIRGVFVNVSTVKTQNEEKLRPFADQRFWLSPEEIVKRSAETIQNPASWTELDVIKPRPGFDERYYRDPSRVARKWADERAGRLPQVAKRLAFVGVVGAALLGISSDQAIESTRRGIGRYQISKIDDVAAEYGREHPEKCNRRKEAEGVNEIRSFEND